MKMTNDAHRLIFVIKINYKNKDTDMPNKEVIELLKTTLSNTPRVE